jgi:hypothetical protein
MPQPKNSQSLEPTAKISIRDLYPELDENELAIAERNLRRYVEIAMEICRDQEPVV